MNELVRELLIGLAVAAGLVAAGWLIAALHLLS